MNRRGWMVAGCAAAVGLLLGAGCFRNTVTVMELDVPAMKSESCAKLVEQAVRKVGDDTVIKSVRVDVGQRKVWVEYDNVRLGRRNIEVAVRHAGFAVNDLPADEAARAKLSRECRGDE